MILRTCIRIVQRVVKVYNYYMFYNVSRNVHTLSPITTVWYALVWYRFYKQANENFHFPSVFFMSLFY